jgi:steroid delta-isomerase-like uncharacterized protein
MKKQFVLIFALILCYMVSCKDREAITELEKLKEETEIAERNKVLAKQYVNAINLGDFDALKELLSPDYEIYSPSGYPKPTSREKLIENLIGAKNSFPEFVWSIEDIIAAKDKVICRIIINGTYKGEILNHPDTEQDFEFSLITIMRIEDGQIVEEWQEDDQLGFARQLGMELKPKELED